MTSSNEALIALATSDPDAFKNVCEVYGLDDQDFVKRAGELTIIAATEGQLD